MIIGHVGVALAARNRWPRATLPWLVGATFAPDLLRLALAATGMHWTQTNIYSHALPWSALLATVVGVAGAIALRDRRLGALLAAVVASHVLLDMISGQKMLWVGGPHGLELGQVEQAEFALEALMLWFGWRLVRGATVPHWVRARATLLLLLGIEGAYLFQSFRARPWATRCVTSPFIPCDRYRSWRERR